jgi:hypothetical protein
VRHGGTTGSTTSTGDTHVCFNLARWFVDCRIGIHFVESFALVPGTVLNKEQAQFLVDDVITKRSGLLLF